MNDRPPQAKLSTLLAMMIIVLVAVATAAIWIELPPIEYVDREPLAIGGVMVALIVWLLTIVSESHRRRARHLAQRYDAVRQRESVVEAPIEIEAPTRVSPMHGPALVSAILVLIGAGALRFVPQIQGALASVDPRILPASGTALMWLIVLTTLRSHAKARQHTIALHAADGGARLLEDVLASFPVMVSVCMPDGGRSSFNARFLERTGREADELIGHGWLECVHDEDQASFEILSDPEAARQSGVVEIEYGLTTRHGANRWVRERFVPRYLGTGELAGYLAVGVDITTQIESETRRAEELEKKNKELAEGRATVEEAKAELKRLKSELTKMTRARDRAQTRAEAAEEEVREARSLESEASKKLSTEKDKHDTTKSDLKQSRFDARKLKLAVERLESKNEGLATSEAAMSRRVEEAEKQLASAVSSAEEDRQAATQLRTKINRLTTRNQELSEELEQLRDGRDEAMQDASRTRANISDEVAQRTKTLAGDLRMSLDGAQRLVDRSRIRPADDEQLDSLDGARAALGSLIALVDGVLGRDPIADLIDQESEESDDRPFDLRAAVELTSVLLEPIGAERSVSIECILDKQFPSQVCGDSVRIREVLLLLGDRALRACPEESSLSVALESEGNAPTLVAAKMSFSASEGEFTDDSLCEMFGVDGASGSDAEEQSRRASMAWELIRSLKGEFGLEARDGGGFTIWFTLNLARWSPTAQQRGGAPEALAPSISAATPAPPAPPTPAANDGPPEAPARTPERRAPEPKQELSPMAQRAAKNSSMRRASKTAAPMAAPMSGPGRRLPQELLKSNLGDVKELGPKGARLRCPKPQKGVVTMILRDSADERVEIRANVVTCDKKGSRHFDTVLEFVGLSARMQQQVLQIAMSHRPITMRPLSDDD